MRTLLSAGQHRAALAALMLAGLTAPGACQQAPTVGYTDTPLLPNSEWRVHDARRPRPSAVAVAPSAAEPEAPPADAVVLFGGVDLSAWRGRGPSGKAKAAQWRVVDGAMIVNGSGNIETREHFGDCQLHLEWMAPAEVKSESQGRGNSGVFLLGKYEIQILDSHSSVTYADGQAAAMYGQRPPLVNACRPPGEWQTYDIVFEAPRFDGEGKLLRPARVTVHHNGVLVHHAAEFLGPTAHRSLPKYTPHDPTGPIVLQDHGNPVRFRNIWVRRLGGEEAK